METETTTGSEFPSGKKATVKQILESEEMNKFKRAGLGESQPGIHVGVGDTKIITEFVRSINSTKIG